MTSPDTTVDSFHRGRFHLVQPARGAHRAGLDAMLLASLVEDGFAGSLADLGAGAGAAGLAVVSRCPAARALLVERDAGMVALARATLALPQNASLVEGRVDILQADIALTGRNREAAGLAPGRHDWVIANPPFNDPGDRQSPHETRQAAHVATPTLFEDWIRTAAAIGTAKARIGLIARPRSLAAILEALGRRAGAIRVTPVQARPGTEAIRILVCATKGSRKPLTLLAPLVLHEAGSDHALTAEADALVNGERGLDQALRPAMSDR